ncbi:transcription factor Jun [Rhipicephalus microplus]|uniref:transcription factor Jun n=1 Tax=Rhipicephalus microplus TaxID=6941 RepID=UPI003F6D2003
MSDLNDSTSDDSFFHRTSLDPLVIDISEEEEQETVRCSGCTSPLSSVGLDENSDDTRKTATQHEQSSSSEELGLRKRSMTLNLYSPGASQPGHKEARCSSLLTSPDLQMLALSTPELEQFIITLNGRETTVSRLSVLTVAKKKERFPSDFAESLDQLQLQSPVLQQHTASGPDTSDSCDSSSNDTRTHPLSFEPETVPIDMRDAEKTQHATSGPDTSDSTSSDSPTRPLSSKTQTAPTYIRDASRMRLEQRRERNRIASSKCLNRKLSRISELREKVYALKKERKVLECKTSILRHEVYQLSQKVVTHVKGGCRM